LFIVVIVVSLVPGLVELDPRITQPMGAQHPLLARGHIMLPNLVVVPSVQYSLVGRAPY